MKNQRYFLLYFLFHSATSGFQLVDVNRASAEQIATLPGVGKTLAEAIITFREKQGPFKRTQDLLRVPGVSDKKLALLEEKIIITAVKKKSEKLAIVEPPLPVLVSHTQKPMIELSKLEEKVLLVAGLDYDFEKNMAKRARQSSWIPKITLLSDYDRHDIAAERTSKKNDDISHRLGSSFEVGIRATFNLPETLYHQSELELARLQLKKLDARQKIVQELHSNYFDYDRLNRELLQPMTKEKYDQLLSQMKKIASKLDSMSKGEFSRFQDQQPS